MELPRRSGIHCGEATMFETIIVEVFDPLNLTTHVYGNVLPGEWGDIYLQSLKVAIAPVTKARALTGSVINIYKITTHEAEMVIQELIDAGFKT